MLEGWGVTEGGRCREQRQGAGGMGSEGRGKVQGAEGGIGPEG